MSDRRLGGCEGSVTQAIAIRYSPLGENASLVRKRSLNGVNPRGLCEGNVNLPPAFLCAGRGCG